MAAFLIVAGATGSVLAFLGDMEMALNPEYRIAEPPGATFSPLALRETLLRRLPDARIDSIPLYHAPGEALHWWMLLPDPEHPAVRVDTDMVVNPYTGEEISRRTTSVWPIHRKNLMAFVYRLHYSLALGDVGLWLFGLAAVLWTLDCFAGVYLTLPGGRADGSFGWWRRWSQAWKIRWRSNAGKRQFDLHRASGLWLWPLLLAFAWSGVSFTLGDAVYRPTMRALFGMAEPAESGTSGDGVHARAVLPWAEGYRRARQLMHEQARLNAFDVLREQNFSYDAARGVFVLTVLSSRDVGRRWGRTELWLDAASGEFRALGLPTGSQAGNTITTWITAIHTASVGGRPMQAMVSAFGFAVALLAVTGVLIWWRKRRARRAINHRRDARS
jgi:uncharacterized iron-regulated membrane protein